MATSIRKTKNIKTYFVLKLLYGIIFVNIEWYHLSSVIDDAWEHRVITKQHHCVIAHECVGSLHQKNRSYHKCDTIIIRVYGVYL